MTDDEQLARIFKVLGVSTRVKILRLLKGGALCVGALAANLDVTQGAVSQHLRILRDAGLVIPERRGYFIHYRLNEETLATWREATGSLLEPGTASSACHASANRCQKETKQCARTRSKKAAKSRKT
ncbi:MAG: metalloregulator ArsR/SmtB family transcription factor [Phycisphaerae bacterium]